MNDEEDFRSVVNLVMIYHKLLEFLYHSVWGFVAAILMLLVAYCHQLHGNKAGGTLIVFTFLNAFSVICYTSFRTIREDIDGWFITIYVIYFIFVDMTVMVALMIVINYGHLWKIESLDHSNKVEVNSQISDLENSASRTPSTN